MSDKYFRPFKRITYNGQKAIDITARPRLLSRVQHNPFLFYDYVLKENERPDQIADRYYGDPYMVWLVYLSNQIVDPYYGWLMDYNEFAAHIKKKYGSIEAAQQQIIWYKNNWEEAEDISVERYDSLDMSELKYYDPVYGARGQVVAYTRKKIDWTLNTNRTVKYSTSGTDFVKGEKVTIEIADGSLGYGIVSFVGDGYVHLQHTSGFYKESTTLTIDGDSTIKGHPLTAITVLAESITDAEEVYWDPIYAYDYEEDQNQALRTIRLLDSKYARQTAKELKDLV
jgi:hypothetical protein